MIDNTTAIAVINNMGTCHSDPCNSIACEIWKFCERNGTWITAAYIPGKPNNTADLESRNKNIDTEWMLNPQCLAQALCSIPFSPSIDLFASHINKQFEVYVSYRPDPYAKHIDAFTISWSNEQFYCFPPFSCILKAIRKIIQDKARGILVVPYWPTDVVPNATTNPGTATYNPPTINQTVANAIPARPLPPTSQNVETSYLSCIRKTLQVKGFTTDTIDIILSSWQDGTKSQYQSVAKRWFKFCEKNNCDAVSPTLPLAMSFLSKLFNSGLSYSYINTARSALSSILCCNNTSIPFGQLPIVKRFMKGVFETRPSLPRYSSTWDLNVAFNYIRQQKPLLLLSLKDL